MNVSNLCKKKRGFVSIVHGFITMKAIVCLLNLWTIHSVKQYHCRQNRRLLCQTIEIGYKRWFMDRCTLLHGISEWKRSYFLSESGSKLQTSSINLLLFTFIVIKIRIISKVPTTSKAQWPSISYQQLTLNSVDSEDSQTHV